VLLSSVPSRGKNCEEDCSLQLDKLHRYNVHGEAKTKYMVINLFCLHRMTSYIAKVSLLNSE